MVRTDEGREKENISNHEIERRGETGKLKIEITRYSKGVCSHLISRPTYFAFSIYLVLHPQSYSSTAVK